MERLIELKTEDPAAYKQLTHGPNGIALGNYLDAKAAYEESKQ